MRRPSPGLGPTSGEKALPRAMGAAAITAEGDFSEDEDHPCVRSSDGRGRARKPAMPHPAQRAALARIGVPVASTRQLHSKGPPTRESSTFLINALVLKYYYENDDHSEIGNVAPARSIEVHYKKRGHEFTQWIARRLDPTLGQPTAILLIKGRALSGRSSAAFWANCLA